MHASKWLKIQALLSAGEMEQLLRELQEGTLYCTGAVIKPGEKIVPHASFLSAYSSYIEALRAGNIPNAANYRRLFSSSLTCSHDAIFVQPVGESKEIARVVRPVVQLQPHAFGYSEMDGKFRPMISGESGVLWGIQFSYPQLFEHPETKQVHKAFTDKAAFPNSVLFQKLQRWIRKETLPTPFVAGGERVNSPIRLGKECFAWINDHRQLQQKGIGIHL